MLGVPVRVHPFFWLMSAILGWELMKQGFAYLLVWIACVFFSVLVHELGHVFMGRLFGTRGHIILYSFGGLAVGSSDLRSRWKRIAVCLAGPGAGFLLCGAVLVAAYFLAARLGNDYLLAALGYLLWINLGWGLLNLLPIYPLDGGQVSGDICGWLFRDNGARVALGISIVLAGLLALNAVQIQTREHALPLLDHIPFIYALGGWWTAILFGWLALNSFQLLQVETHRRPWDRDDDDVWK